MYVTLLGIPQTVPKGPCRACFLPVHKPDGIPLPLRRELQHEGSTPGGPMRPPFP